MAAKFLREKWFAGLGIVLCALVILPTLTKRTDRADLRLLVNAGERLASGKLVYNLGDLDEHTKPPLCTLLFLPAHRIDFFVLGRIWDVLNLVVFVCLAFFFARRFQRPNGPSVPRLALLGCLFTLTAWNAEIRLGQFNVIGMGLMILAAEAGPILARGGALAVALLLKPTNIIFLPWVVRYGRRPLPLAAATAGVLVGLTAIYLVLFGYAAFVEDHRSWLAFLGPSTAKHIVRLDNLGLPSVFAISTGNSLQNFFLALGGGLTALLAWKFPRRPWEVFSLAAAMVIVFSPMAWPQNYSLLLPLAIWMWAEYWEGVPAGPSLVLLYVTQQIYNPSTWDYWGPLGRWKVPLVGTGLVLAAFFAALKKAAAPPAPETRLPKAPA